jgi:CHAT domain-containing protein/tetratricopeptide (TPR) repeat protein
MVQAAGCGVVIGCGPRGGRHPGRFGSSAAALVVAVTGPWRSSSRDLQALVAAVGTDRTFEPRLTGGFAYGPVKATRGAAADAAPDVRMAAAQIDKDAVGHRTPDMLRTLGISHLITGDIERGIAALQEAADRPSPSAQVLSDLSAAYLVRASLDRQPQDFTKALEYADRAVKADPRLAEALFNRAYALERLSLADDARQAWQEYLKIDPHSGWADEANAHLRSSAPGSPRSSIEQKRRLAEVARSGDRGGIRAVVEEWPDLAREWTQDQLLVEWSRDVLERRRIDADAALAGLRVVAQQLAATTQDRFLSDAIEVARLATDDTGATYASALQSIQAGSMDYGEDRIAESVVKFQSALPALQRLHSPFELTSRLNLAIGRYTSGDFVNARNMVEPVIAAAQERHFLRLAGSALRMRGLIKGVSGDLAGASEDYRMAVAALVTARDYDGEAAARAILAEDLDMIGESRLAWADFGKGLQLLPFVRERRSRHTVLQLVSQAAVRQGDLEAAQYFQRSVLDNAMRWGRPLAVLNARMFQADILRESGDLDGAARELDIAYRSLGDVSDHQLAARDAALIQLAKGEVQLARRPAEAVAFLTDALAFFQQTKRNWLMARVLLGRARAQVHAGREDLAEMDLASGIDLFERQRSSIADEALRGASFEQPWDLYSEMIRLQVRRNRPDRALAFAERGRARTLVESISTSAATTYVNPAVARAGLPQSVACLYYVALDDRFLVWVLTRSQLRFVQTPAVGSEVTHLLSRFHAEIAAGPGYASPTLARLYDILIRPAVNSIPKGAQLVIVPDGILHEVPFAALLRADRGPYLIEEHSIQITPSMTVLLEATRKQMPRADTSVLVFGNPLASEGSELPALPEAEAEARDVAALYAKADLFVGKDATKDAFLSGAGDHAVVHFAGHAIANATRPDLSRLVVAGPDESSRTLTAREIAMHDFRATRLVVLAACRTNAGRIRRGEGVFSLARPFLAAGVQTVVATLWDVDDHASRRLLVAFHRALPKAGSPAEALRRAQLELIHDSDSTLRNPAAWSGFASIGS